MQAFFDYARAKLFSGTLSQPQVDGLNVLLAAWAVGGDGDKRKLAYVLATAFHETARTMQPVTEYGPSAYLKAKPYWPYIGRGYVQLTWKYNYQMASTKLGLPSLLSSPPQAELVAFPDKALQPDIAAKIIVRGMSEGWFTGNKKKLSDYIGNSCDFVAARAIVNGNDRAVLIAGYATEFLNALNKVDASAPQPAPQPVSPAPQPIPALPTKPAPTGFWRALFAAILALLSRKIK